MTVARSAFMPVREYVTESIQIGLDKRIVPCRGERLHRRGVDARAGSAR